MTPQTMGELAQHDQLEPRSDSRVTAGGPPGMPEHPQQDPAPLPPGNPVDPAPQQPELPPVSPHTPTLPQPHMRRHPVTHG